MVLDLIGGIFPPLGLYQQTQKIISQTKEAPVDPERPKTITQPWETTTAGSIFDQAVRQHQAHQGTGQIGIQTTPETHPSPPSPLSSIFPPLALWQQSQYMKDIQSWQATPPPSTIYGTPEDIATYQQLAPAPTVPTGNGNGGVLGDVEGVMKILMIAIPLFIGLGLLGKVKKLF